MISLFIIPSLTSTSTKFILLAASPSILISPLTVSTTTLKSFASVLSIRPPSFLTLMVNPFVIPIVAVASNLSISNLYTGITFAFQVTSHDSPIGTPTLFTIWKIALIIVIVSFSGLKVNFFVNGLAPGSSIVSVPTL